MTLEDAGEDQIAHRQRRIERLRRAAAGVAQCLVAGPADLALPPRRRVQAQRQVERRGGGPERLVLGLVVAPVLERILGDHRPGQAQAGGALQLPDPVRDVVQVDHRDALQAGGIRAAARTAALRAFRGSASQSLYARKMADISSVSATLK